MKDSEIVELLFARDEKALAEAQEKYGKYCGYISGNILHNAQDAEECVNEALHALWKSVPPQKPENLKTYLGKIVRNISLSRWRKNCAGKRINAENALSLDEIADIAADGDFDAKITEEALAREISVFLRSLPETERNIFIRRYWYCDSIADICKRYAFGESKVKVTLKRTRDKLAKRLKKEGYIT